MLKIRLKVTNNTNPVYSYYFLLQIISCVFEIGYFNVNNNVKSAFIKFLMNIYCLIKSFYKLIVNKGRRVAAFRSLSCV